MAIPLNLLLVEDSQDDAKLLLAELWQAGFEACPVRVETEADFVREISKAPDLVISDFSMPQFDGLRALAILKQSGWDIPFILMSGTIGEEVAVEAMRHGATDYLLKDRLSRLGSAVERALEDGRLRKERRQEQEELRLTHLKLSQLLEHSPAVIYSLKVEGEKVTPQVVSENMVRLTGFTVEEGASYDWWARHLHPDDQEQQFANIGVTLSSEGLRTEYRLRHKAGHYIWVEDSRKTVRDADGRPVSIAGVWTNITVRKLADEEIRIQLHELQRWHEAMLGREERVLELKREINELLVRQNQPARYTEPATP